MKHILEIQQLPNKHTGTPVSNDREILAYLPNDSQALLINMPPHPPQFQAKLHLFYPLLVFSMAQPANDGEIVTTCTINLNYAYYKNDVKMVCHPYVSASKLAFKSPPSQLLHLLQVNFGKVSPATYHSFYRAAKTTVSIFHSDFAITFVHISTKNPQILDFTMFEMQSECGRVKSMKNRRGPQFETIPCHFKFILNLNYLSLFDVFLPLTGFFDTTEEKTCARFHLKAFDSHSFTDAEIAKIQTVLVLILYHTPTVSKPHF